MENRAEEGELKANVQVDSLDLIFRFFYTHTMRHHTVHSSFPMSIMGKAP